MSAHRPAVVASGIAAAAIGAGLLDAGPAEAGPARHHPSPCASVTHVELAAILDAAATSTSAALQTGANREVQVPELAELLIEARFSAHERLVPVLAQAIADAGRQTGPYGIELRGPRPINGGHVAKAREFAATLVREGIV